MRVFWAIVALLVLAGIGIPAVRKYERKHDAEVAAKAAADEARAREVEARAAAEQAKAAQDAAAESSPKVRTDAASAPTTSAAPSGDPSVGDTKPATPGAAARPVDPSPSAVQTKANGATNEAEEPAATTTPAKEQSKEDAVHAPVSADAARVEPAKPPEAPSPGTSTSAAGTKDTANAPAPATGSQTKPSTQNEPPKTEVAATALTTPTPGAPAASAPPSEQAQGEKAQAAESAGPKIEKKSDSTMVVDGKYEVKGEGTKAHPYEITWDMLVSAQESYDPRQGRKKLPERLTMLNDKYLKITGYIAFPMFVERPQELLSMLNQWDGCCIGVPPTPYDAVEVHLAEPVTKDQRAAVYGVVTGKFGVKPYLAGDWLVGLYLMENAEFESKGFGGT